MGQEGVIKNGKKKKLKGKNGIQEEKVYTILHEWKSIMNKTNKFNLYDLEKRLDWI